MQKDELFELVRKYTVLSEQRKNALYDCTRIVNSNNITGDFVECGVFNGGSAGILGDLLMESELTRKLWLFDSFQGLPEPSPVDIDSHGVKGESGLFTGSEDRVKELIFGKLKMKYEQVKIIKGWFKDTIPEASDKIQKIAILHLDCDFYESVRICMDHFYDKIQSGGFLIIDDYGRWTGCKKAIDEFFQERHMKPQLNESDYTGRYFQKKDA